jgi:Fe-S-cluster-containing dehydrogenase component/anaerobic selenocysteine-containing dehydrogenase
MTSSRTIPIHSHPPAREDGADALQNPGRRALLRLMAASAALAGAGCSGPPQEAIVPYVDMPEGQPAGEPVYYASAVVRDGYAHGVLVETNDGRPTKVEGNPLHAMSGGTSDVHSQAAILQMWDPDRSRAIAFKGGLAGWDALRTAVSQRLPAWQADGGRGLRILTGTVTSPTLLRQLQALQRQYPAMQWHRHDPLHDGAAQAGASSALGVPAMPRYHLDQARVVVTAGADLLGQGPAAARHARDFMATRRGDGPRSRLYALETTPGLTGAMADDRRALSPAAMETVLRRLAGLVGIEGWAPAQTGTPAAWETALAQALREHAGQSLLAPGPALSPQAHALAWAINTALGNVGRTVTALPAATPLGLAELVHDMQAHQVDTLVIIDTNPAYDAPGELDFGKTLANVDLSLHMGLYQDETGRAATWHLPRAHDFEDWSDARAWDGTASIVQPVIAPLHGGRSPHVLLSLLADGVQDSARAQVRETWRAQWQGEQGVDEKAFEIRWRDALRKGYIAGSAPTPINPSPSPSPLKPAPFAAASPAVSESPAVPPAGSGSPAASPAVSGSPAASPAVSGFPAAPPAVSGQTAAHTLLAVFVPDASAGAGAWSNNAWLQELPRPLTQMTWDNAALMAARTAYALGLDTGDVVTLAGRHASIEAPVFILAGHAEDTVSLPLGYGRRAAGRVGNGVGFDAYPLQELDAAGQPALQAQVTVQRTGRRHSFARVQTENVMHGRDLVRVVELDKLDAVAPQPAGLMQRERQEQPSLYPPVAYPDYAWAMTIDLDTCIGCNTCTIACQAENNIPVVGKDQVARGREMHWIRVDTYHDAQARTLFQPVPCMHCENAPCELVCPVGATVHDSEGLNAQVYNRCVGTRFCSNNCPYKVRRFNFYQYADESEDAAVYQNPDVTVRQRGVMEKCTYCVQRISRARIEAEKEGRAIRDGEVVTACQSACPTQAIVFGNLNDPASRISQAKASPRSYALLEEMNTRPRTTYQARVVDGAARLEPTDE